MVRVLMVSRGVLPIGRRSGGAELAAFELARHLALQGHEVTLVADVDQAAHESAPPAMTVCPLINGKAYVRFVLKIPFTLPRWLGQHLVGNIRAARSAVSALKGQNPRFDVVHTHGALATIMVARAMRRSRLRVPLVYTEHDSTPWMCAPRGALERLVRRIVYRSVNLRACRHAQLVLTSYAALAKELSERTGLRAEHFGVAPNGTDVERFVAAERVTATRARPATKRPYFLFVGSLIERKSPDLLLHSLAQARTDLDLVLVGNGPMLGELERLARRLSLSERVLFAGAQPHSVVRGYYQGAAFVVLPSVSETAPLVLIEALSTGKPVIATRLKGIETIVRHGENGLLVPPRDTNSLAAAIDLLTRDEALYRHLASNAAESVRGRFAWEVIARKVHSFYSSQAKSSDSSAVPDRSPSPWIPEHVNMTRLTIVRASSGTGNTASEEETAHA